MATNYASESVEKPGGGTDAGGDHGSRQRLRRTNCNDNNIESNHQPHKMHHLSPRDLDDVGALQAAMSTSDQPSSDSESYASRTHNEGTVVGTQTRTRSDRKYSIPERARRAIINYLSRYKTLRISVRACPPVSRQTWHL